MKRFSLVVVLLLCTLCLFSRNLVDTQGTLVPEADYARIVSLGPTVTETVCALGAEDKLVGRTAFCNYPESVLKLPSIGTLTNPSVETVLRLHPDLVIAGSLIDEPFLASLRKAGLTVCVLNHEASFDGTYAMIRDIGALIGKEETAEAVIQDMRTKILRITEQAKGLPHPKTYLATSFGNYDSTATGDTYLGAMIEMAGGDNVAKDSRNWSFSKEELLRSGAEVVILMNMNGKTPEETLELWKHTKPYKDIKSRLGVVDADLIARQGPRLAEALEALYRIIHP